MTRASRVPAEARRRGLAVEAEVAEQQLGQDEPHHQVEGEKALPGVAGLELRVLPQAPEREQGIGEDGHPGEGGQPPWKAGALRPSATAPARSGR